jgi:mRNA interferase HigB
VRVIAQSSLSSFWERDGHDDAERPLRAWYAEAEAADWRTPADIKAAYGSASILQSGRAVFNIKGNKYRLVVHVRYPYVYVRFIGTHEQYDRIDAQTV